jgi:hypothetical protein
MGAGLICAVIALFMAPMSLRELCVHANRERYVHDELELVEFRESRGGHSSDWLEARVVSTGERYATDRLHVLGQDRLRELHREHELEGHRVPVWYLPKRGLWPAIDWLNPFRVQSPEEFAMGLPAGLIAANVAIGLTSIALIRLAIGLVRKQATGS